MFLRLCIIAVTAGCLVAQAASRTANGNEFALHYSEASTDAEREAVIEEARGRRHYFRYLQIMEMSEATDEHGRAGVAITAFEPSSLMDVVFNIVMPASLSKLREEPASGPGDAIAVTGRVVEVCPEREAVVLNPAIVRHKDRLSPAAGKEMLYEVDPEGVFYSFTGGPRPVHLSYRDRDLLRHRGEILEKRGARAWVEFLEGELRRRREQQRECAESGRQ